jgi:hypothetical protein
MVYQPVHSLLSEASQELEPCGADRSLRKHCRRAALQRLILPALARKHAAVAAAGTASAAARDAYTAAAATCEITLDAEQLLPLLAWKEPPVADSFAAAMSFDMQQILATFRLSRLSMELLEEIAAHSLKHQYDMEPLLATVMIASARRTAACDAATSAVCAYQRARGNTVKVAAAAAELLRAHGRRREHAAELRKAAAALGIAAEAAVADADAAAAVKQCLEIHCIDKAAVSRHEQACEDCRQLYAQLLQLCSKLGLPSPPGAPPAAAAAAAAAVAAESAAEPEEGPV